MAIDLFGDEFAGLFVKRNGSNSLAPSASNYLTLGEGTIFLWPSELYELSQEELRDQITYLKTTFSKYRRIKSRDGEPLIDVVEQMLSKDNVDVGVFNDYNFVTRKSITDKLGAKDLLDLERQNVVRAIFSRIQNDLEEYNFLSMLIPSSGPRPAVCVINYPFEPKEPVAHEIIQSPDIDLSSYGEMLPLNDEEKQIQLTQLARTVTHKGRPHSTTDADGNLIRVYEKEAVLRSPSGHRTTVAITAEIYAGSEGSVMTKTDDQIFGFVLSWCMHQIKGRKRLGKPLDDWYVISPEIIMELTGAPRGRKPEIIEMILRWKNTRLQASSVRNIEGSDDDGEFIAFITKEAITQFGETKERWTVNRQGNKVLKQLAFTLPQTTQKELERRALFDKDSEVYVQGLPQMLQATGNKTLLTDSFAVAVSNFFQLQAKNYVKGLGRWESELWAGLTEMFDFDFIEPPSDLSEAKRRSKKDNQKKQFLRYLMRFFSSFSQNPEADYDTFMSIEGGLIRLKVINFFVEIELHNRKAKNLNQKGLVRILSPNSKNLLGNDVSQQPDIDIQAEDLTDDEQMAIDCLVRIGLTNVVAAKFVEQKGLEFISKAVDLTVLKVQTDDVLNPAGYLASLMNSNTIESLERSIESLEMVNSRQLLAASMRDIKDTNW